MREECEECGRQGPGVELCNTRRGDTEAFHGYRPGQLCRRCHVDILPDPQLVYPQLVDDTFDFYYSAASGTTRKVLKRMDETHTLVSYLTRNNGRIGTEESHFIDCGGNPATFLGNDDINELRYPDSHSSYLDYVEQTVAGPQDRWALRDFPATTQIQEAFDVDVADIQRRTTDAHRALLNEADDQNISAQPLSILQGETVRDYLVHLDQLEDHGVLTDYVGIGSFALKSADFKQKTILAVRDALSPSIDIHGLGVSLETLAKDDVISALRSADSGGWASQRANTDHPAWDDDQVAGFRPTVYEYLEYSRELGELIQNNDLASSDDALGQFTDVESQIDKQWGRALSGDGKRALDEYHAGTISRRPNEKRSGESQENIQAFG